MALAGLASFAFVHDWSRAGLIAGVNDLAAFEAIASTLPSSVGYERIRAFVTACFSQ